MTAFAYVFYSPLEQAEIAETALATAAYVSNAHFALGATDYLAAAAETNPLLHTWSLAVEEQFYLGWPLLVLLGLVGLPGLRRGRAGRERAPSHRRLAWAMGGVAVATFALTLYLMGTLRVHWAFFASPPRAWEFALGGLGAVLPRVRFTSARGAEAATSAHLLGWIGLTAVVGAGVLYTATTAFPGWTAAVPVLGTVMALRAGVGQPATTLGRALSWRPLLEAGRLSYSWYLWHWPVLVFAEGLYGEGVGGELSLPVRVGLVLVSLALAEGSYRLVEDPVRHQRWLAARPRRGIALLGVVTAFGVGLAITWGYRAHAATMSPMQHYFTSVAADKGNDCLDLDTSNDRVHKCVLGDPRSSTTVALVGDSHAHHWLPALELVAATNGWQIHTYLKSACGILDATQWRKPMGRDYVECDRWKASVLDSLRKDRPDITIVSSANSSHGRLDEGELEPGVLRMYQKISRLSGAVVQLQDTPSLPFDAAHCLSRAQWRGLRLGSSCQFTPAPEGDIEQAQSKAADQIENVVSLDLDPMVCSTTPCSVFQGEQMVFRDADHLSTEFARSLAPQLSSTLADALRDMLRPRESPLD